MDQSIDESINSIHHSIELVRAQMFEDQDISAKTATEFCTKVVHAAFGQEPRIGLVIRAWLRQALKPKRPIEVLKELVSSLCDAGHLVRTTVKGAYGAYDVLGLDVLKPRCSVCSSHHFGQVDRLAATDQLCVVVWFMKSLGNGRDPS